MTASGAAVGAVRVAEAIDRIARTIAAGLELPDLSRSVAREVREALGAETVAVYLVEGATLRCTGAAGPAAAGLEGKRTPLSAGLAGEAARTGRPALAPAGAGSRARMAVPLIVRGHAVGAVEAAGDPERELRPLDRRLLERLAPHVAAAVTNATFAGEVRRSRDELARHDEDLERRVRAYAGSISAAKREWEQAFDAIADPMAVYEEGVVRRANLAYAAAAGLDIRRVSGLPCHVARFGRDRPCTGCPIHDRVAADAIEAEVREGDGTYQLRGFRLNDPNRPHAWVVSYREVTEERRARARLAEAERLAAVGRLAAGAAHEINNPMAFVTSALRTLREHVADLIAVASGGTVAAELAAAGDAERALRALARVNEKAREVGVREVAEDAGAILAEAENGARRITAIVQALKVLGQEELGRDEPFDVAVVLERAVERARQAGAFPRVEWLHREAVRAFGSPVQFDRAFFEILRNAGQAAGPGGTVRLSCRARRGEAEVAVVDDGPGIPAEHLPRIFEPFFTTRDIGQGVGLGLTIAYGVVRRYDGAIEVESTPSRGTAVRIVLTSTPPPVPGEDRDNPSARR